MRYLVLSGLALLQMLSLRAQILNDFSGFDDASTTYFNGSWSSGGNMPLGSFSQEAGVYNIVGGTNDSMSGVDFYYLSSSTGDIAPISIGSNHALSLTAMLLPANSATSLTITLFDNSASTHFASTVFDLTSFSASTYTTSVSALTAGAGFDWSAIQGFSITGATTGGTSALNISFDSLAAVPEPSTYAAVLGSLMLGVVGYRRFRKR